jgi:hypothetical protein
MAVKKSFFIISLADMIFASIFLFLSFHIGGQLLNDADTGYHIRAGEFILESFSIPRYDMFSFHTPPIPWTAHEWLSEVIMAVIHGFAGLTGIVIFFSFLIALTYYLLFRIIRAESDNILLAVLIILLVITSSQIHWLARPHIFSLLLMVIWYKILDEYQYRTINRLYLLPIIMLLWVNLHGGFLAGFILLAIFWFGNLLKFYTNSGEEKELAGRKIRHIGLAIISCLVMSLINPFGYHILLFPFSLVNNKFLMDRVMEFLSPNFHDPLVFKYFLLLMIAVFAISRKRLNSIELLLVILFTNMALYAVRYIPLYAIVVAPILLRQIESLLNETDNQAVRFFKQRAVGISSIDGRAKGFLWFFAGILIVVAFASSGRIKYGFDPKLKPVAAVEFLMKEPINGNMFNDNEFGDYIIYAAWPKYKVFFDGRSDMYGTDILKEYDNICGFESGWDSILAKYNISWLVIETNSALSRFLLDRNNWKLIYADKVAHIFVKDIPEHQLIINKYKNVKPFRKEKLLES